MNAEKYKAVCEEIKTYGAKLVAVSKTFPAASISNLYAQGQRIFGESKVQELLQKQSSLPDDIEWHLIGHLQSNKVKQIVPFVAMIHSVDSFKLLAEINKQAAKQGRIIDCLLQVFIADEETKFGLNENELIELLNGAEFAEMKNVRICGLMGMATNTDDEEKIASEFAGLHSLFTKIKSRFFSDESSFKDLSMGMSSDYKIAMKNGATLVRLGSVIFGGRD
jgi:pyridoxal phosphate enzyme (YggS family)